MVQPTGQYVKSQPSQTTDVSVLRSFGPLFEFIITTLILDRTSYKGLYIEWISSKDVFEQDECSREEVRLAVEVQGNNK